MVRQSFIQENQVHIPQSPEHTHTHTHIGPPFPMASLQYRHMVESCTPSDPDIRQQSTLGNTVNASLMFGAEVLRVFLQDKSSGGAVSAGTVRNRLRRFSILI